MSSLYISAESLTLICLTPCLRMESILACNSLSWTFCSSLLTSLLPLNEDFKDSTCSCFALYANSKNSSMSASYRASIYARSSGLSSPSSSSEGISSLSMTSSSQSPFSMLSFGSPLILAAVSFMLSTKNKYKVFRSYFSRDSARSVVFPDFF